MIEPEPTPRLGRNRRTERSHLPRIEFRKSQRRDAVYYLAAFLAVFLSWTVRIAPNRLEEWVARRIGDLSYLASRQWRANVASNISHVIDEPESSARVQRTARSIFQANALNVVSLLRAPHQSPEQLLGGLRLPHGDWDIVEDALARGNGVIVLTAHLGSFDTMGSALVAKGFPMAALTARTTNRFMFEFISFLRQSHNIQLIEASSSGVREAIEFLRAGKVLCLLSDRDFFLNGREVEFFGEETTLPVGAARLARDTGATVVPIFTVRQGTRNDLMIEPSFTVPKTDSRDLDIESAMRLTTAALEQGISTAPDQWVMFQRVWPESVQIPTR